MEIVDAIRNLLINHLADLAFRYDGLTDAEKAAVGFDRETFEQLALWVKGQAKFSIVDSQDIAEALHNAFRFGAWCLDDEYAQGEFTEYMGQLLAPNCASYFVGRACR